MPPSSRRRTRRTDARLQETSDAEAPDSSPSRPASKKRKVSFNFLSKKKTKNIRNLMLFSTG
jgi:hypothetical protein